ncbi:hypothetical protein ACLD0U_08685 [Microbacterium sp. 2216-1]|uniref:hypothetical protein n=1 Tax=Microbacterium sp. 2216-1 TaxID=3390053 RepID=UPI00397502C3
MSNDELKASDRLYYAIAALRGWDEAADEARGYGGSYAVRFGRIVSSILIAADDDREPVAITGALDDQRIGNLAVVYDRFVVVVDIVELTAHSGELTVTVHGLDAIEDVRVSTTHNYFEGTDSKPASTGWSCRSDSPVNGSPSHRRSGGRVRCSTVTPLSRRTLPSATIGPAAG